VARSTSVDREGRQRMIHGGGHPGGWGKDEKRSRFRVSDWCGKERDAWQAMSGWWEEEKATRTEEEG
jgi:hypothetical protein